MSKRAKVKRGEFRKRVTDQHANENERKSYTVKLVRHDERNGGIAQLGEHLLCKQRVRSSILLTSTKKEAS